MKSFMKTSKFREAQIAFVLKQAEDGTPAAEGCRTADDDDRNSSASASGKSGSGPRRAA
jgi:hypothetical protein